MFANLSGNPATLVGLFSMMDPAFCAYSVRMLIWVNLYA